MLLDDLEFDDEMLLDDDNDDDEVKAYWDLILGPDDEDWLPEDEDEDEDSARTSFPIKHIADGCTTLEEAADRLHAQASWLEELANDGYTLEFPVVDGYFEVLKPQYEIEAEEIEKRL